MIVAVCCAELQRAAAVEMLAAGTVFGNIACDVGSFERASAAEKQQPRRR